MTLLRALRRTLLVLTGGLPEIQDASLSTEASDVDISPVDRCLSSSAAEAGPLPDPVSEGSGNAGLKPRRLASALLVDRDKPISGECLRESVLVNGSSGRSSRNLDIVRTGVADPPRRDVPTVDAEPVRATCGMSPFWDKDRVGTGAGMVAPPAKDAREAIFRAIDSRLTFEKLLGGFAASGRSCSLRNEGPRRNMDAQPLELRWLPCLVVFASLFGDEGKGGRASIVSGGPSCSSIGEVTILWRRSCVELSTVGYTGRSGLGCGDCVGVGLKAGWILSSIASSKGVPRR